MLDFKLLKNKLFYGEDYGKVIVDEVIPIFHDYAKTANKTVYIFKKDLSDNKAEFSEGNSTYVKIFNPNKFLSQNGIPIKIYEQDFNKGLFDITFEKNGYKVGALYEFNGLGYLGNLSNLCEIKLVTDQYVIFNCGKNVLLYSYKELNRLIYKRVI